LAFSSDGKTLVAGTDRGTSLWDTLSRKERLFLQDGHAGKIRSVCFAPDGKTLASGGDDGAVRFWDIAGRKERAVLGGGTGSVRKVWFGPGGKTVISWKAPFAPLDDVTDVERIPPEKEGSGEIVLWDTATGKQRVALEMEELLGVPLKAVAVSPDGKWVAAGLASQPSRWPGVRLWDTDTGKQRRPLEDCEGVVTTLAFSPDGQMLAVAKQTEDEDAGEALAEVGLWDARTRRRVAVLKRQRGLIDRLTFDRDGKALAWVYQPGVPADTSKPTSTEVRVWDLARGREQTVLRSFGFRCVDLAFSPADRTLALAGDVLDRSEQKVIGHAIKLWDLQTEQELATLRGHGDT